MKVASLAEHRVSAVLVADHDEKSRERIGSALASAGYDVLLLESFDRLLACNPRAARCCLVMDFRLQGMNGLHLWTRFKAERAQLPVVFTSASANLAAAVSAMKAGAVDFLSKPVCEEALFDAVQAALEQDAVTQFRQNALKHVETLYGSLSPRERDVMRHVTAGLMNKQVAGIMGLSEITVKVHRGRVMRKMNARTFADLVRQAHVLPNPRSTPGHGASSLDLVPAASLPAFLNSRRAPFSVHV